MTTAAEVQALFGPRHSVAMRQVQLDPVTAFTCWNILATVLDQLTDIRACITAGELPVASVIDFVGHMPEDLLAFVMSQNRPDQPQTGGIAMPKAFHIDVVAQTIKLVECSGFREMQLLIGGPIEAASHLPTGDVLFVDEEGLLKRPPGFFMFALRPDQPLASNGLVVGRERYDREGNFLGQDDPRITLAQLRELVRFVDRAFVDSWGKANSSEAASSFTILQEDGTPKREVLAHWGKVIGDLPKDPESEEDK